MNKKEKETLEKLRQLCEVATSNGNYDCNEYLHGMANGMLFALSMFEGTVPQFLEAPRVYLDDLKLLESLNEYGVRIRNS
jgi:hypothetical protein